MAQYIYSKSHTNWKRVGKGSLWIILIVVLILVGLLLFLFKINQFSLQIRLLGEDTVILEYGDTYTEPGAEIYLLGTHIFQDGIIIRDSHLFRDGEPNMDTAGTYQLTYTGALFGLSDQCTRSVMVVDSVSPVITLSEDIAKRWHIGYTAVDNHDGDITDQVRCTESLGRMTFAVMDSSGNPAYVEKSVPFYDIEPPEIILDGGDGYVIPVGFRYVEPGYSAVDNADGLMTDSVLVDGEVNWFIPGIYPITYISIDSAGNEANVIRNVEVVARKRPKVEMPANKTVYLTFDDGPGPYTEQLLDVLDKYQIKATFFVTNSEQKGLMKEIVNRGHSIGIHSVTHDYESVYASPEAYFEDLRQMQDIIRTETGVVTTLVRFPGGSSNTVSKATYPGIMTLLTEAVQDAGYQFFDWNVDSDDAGTARNAGTVFENVVQGIAKERVSVVLQHDIHEYSVDAVERIILWCLERNYQFLPLTSTSPGFHHPIAN